MIENNEMFKFVVYGEIKPKQRPRARVVNGRFAQVYTPSVTATYENLIRTVYQNSNGKYFGTDPLSVVIKAYFNPNKEQQKYVERDLACTNHKDLDNIAKTVLDALNGIAYVDDKQIFSLLISKEYSINGREFIDVELNAHKQKSLANLKECDRLDRLYFKLEKYRSKKKLSAQDLETIAEIKRELDEANYYPF